MCYCFMHIEKVKNAGTIQAKYNHNYRIADVKNAAKELSHFNDEVVPLPLADGRKITYLDAFKERISSLDYYQDGSHKIRKNGVWMLEIVMSYDRKKDFNLEHWKAKNVEWLEDTFNVAPDDKNNVISVVYHGDEAGCGHLHAMVIPVDENGRLNASRFLDGSRVLSNLQTAYANEMKEFGLVRGEKGSIARHEDIRKFYADLNQALADIPPAYEHEIAADYRERVCEEIGTANAAALRRIKVAERKSLQRITHELQNKKTTLKAELSSLYERKQQLLQDIKNIESQQTHSRKELNTLREESDCLERRMRKKEKRYQEMYTFEQHLASYEKDYPEEAMHFKKKMDEIMLYESRIHER